MVFQKSHHWNKLSVYSTGRFLEGPENMVNVSSIGISNGKSNTYSASKVLAISIGFKWFQTNLVEFEIFVTAYIIGGSLVAYQIGYVVKQVSS